MVQHITICIEEAAAYGETYKTIYARAHFDRNV